MKRNARIGICLSLFYCVVAGCAPSLEAADLEQFSREIMQWHRDAREEFFWRLGPMLWCDFGGSEAERATQEEERRRRAQQNEQLKTDLFAPVQIEYAEVLRVTALADAVAPLTALLNADLLELLGHHEEAAQGYIDLLEMDLAKVLQEDDEEDPQVLLDEAWVNLARIAFRAGEADERYINILWEHVALPRYCGHLFKQPLRAA